MDAIERSAIHRSLATSASRVALARSRHANAALNDPAHAIDILRSVLQKSINEEIRKVLQRFRDGYFAPAVANASRNLGAGKVSDRLVDDVCANALEHAKKALYEKEDDKLKKSNPDGTKKLSRPNTDLILVYKSGKPVRREGPLWEPSRITEDTFFILGSKANKAMGFGQTRGRLYIKHPELLKYSGDQEDKEWLAKNQLMSTTGGKAYLMVLDDIVGLVRSNEYASHPRLQPDQLVGFKAPSFMVKKIRRFTAMVRTKPMIDDDDLIAEGKRQIASWERERKKLCRRRHRKRQRASNPSSWPVTTTAATATARATTPPQNSILMDEDEELGFLHGMNLNNLVREFEMESTSNDNNLESILSLADEDEEANEVEAEKPKG